MTTPNDATLRHPALTIARHPVVEHALGVMRSRTTPPAAFRQAAAQAATAVLLEATRDLPLLPIEVETPLVKTAAARIDGRVGLVPILRAGLGFVQPALALLPDAEIWHLGIFRDEKTLQPVTYYDKLHRANAPDVAIVLDPMLATGGSAAATLTVVKRWMATDGARDVVGAPSRQGRDAAPRLKYACLIAAPEGLRHLAALHPDVPVFTAGVDERLNDVGYILPGLGDAGDRLFGTLG